MTISVVIPAYNEEKLLPATLASLRLLTRKPDEVLVINASSTDTTKEVAQKFGARVITVPKTTIGASRQKGIEKAKSDIIAFTDADAVVPPDWLTKIETTLSHPGVCGVFGEFRVTDGPWWYQIYINKIQPPVNHLLWKLSIPMATGQTLAFFRQKALEAGGIPLEYKIAEDIELARRLMSVGTLVYRQDLIVIASGRRGNEGIGIFYRIPRAFFYYWVFRKADKIGFPSIRD